MHPLNAPSSMLTIEEGILILVNEVQLSKVYLSIFVKEGGITISDNDEHPSKALLPRYLIEFGSSNFTEINELHSMKACVRISFTEEGIVISSSKLHFSKAP